MARKAKFVGVDIRLGGDVLKFYKEWAELAGTRVEDVLNVVISRHVLLLRRAGKLPKRRK